MTEGGPVKKIDFAMASFILALTLAVLNGVQAFNFFNNTTSSDIAVLKRDVQLLWEERNRRCLVGEQDGRRP